MTKLQAWQVISPLTEFKNIKKQLKYDHLNMTWLTDEVKHLLRQL